MQKEEENRCNRDEEQGCDSRPAECAANDGIVVVSQFLWLLLWTGGRWFGFVNHDGVGSQLEVWRRRPDCRTGRLDRIVCSKVDQRVARPCEVIVPKGFLIIAQRFNVGDLPRNENKSRRDG